MFVMLRPRCPYVLTSSYPPNVILCDQSHSARRGHKYIQNQKFLLQSGLREHKYIISHAIHVIQRQCIISSYCTCWTYTYKRTKGLMSKWVCTLYQRKRMPTTDYSSQNKHLTQTSLNTLSCWYAYSPYPFPFANGLDVTPPSWSSSVFDWKLACADLCVPCRISPTIAG